MFMYKIPKQRYAPEFKQEAVRQAENGKNLFTIFL
jgi:transposase-like protein